MHRTAPIILIAFFLIVLGLPWGGIVQTASAQVSVTSAYPTSVEQGTLGLNVTIGGKGFKNRAKAFFYLKDTTNPAGVTVRATKFVDETTLVATIDVSATAVAGGFDIIVQNTDGRTGKGTGLFSVSAKAVAPPDVPVSVSLDASHPNQIRPEFTGDPYDDVAQWSGLYPNLRPGTKGTYDFLLHFRLNFGSRDSYIASRRSVVFDFGQGRFQPGAMVPCYPTVLYPEDEAKVPYWFPLPQFLTTTGIPAGSQKPFFVDLQTTYEWVKDAEGVWRDTGVIFDLSRYMAGAPPVEPRYVEIIFYFLNAELNDSGATLYLSHNGPIEPPSAYSTTRGLAQVTSRPAGGFVLAPVAAESLLGSSFALAPLYPPLGLSYDLLPGPGQANVTIKVPLDRKRGFKALSGVCNVGTFDMPFAMTVTQR